MRTSGAEVLAVVVRAYDLYDGSSCNHEVVENLPSVEAAVKCFRDLQWGHGEGEVDFVASFIHDECKGKTALESCLFRYWGRGKDLPRGVRVFNRLMRQEIYQQAWDRCLDIFDRALGCIFYLNYCPIAESIFHIDVSEEAFGHWSELDVDPDSEIGKKFEELYNAAGRP